MLVIEILYLIFNFNNSDTMNNDNKITQKTDYKLWVLIVISIFLIFYSLIYLYNYYSHNHLLTEFPNNYYWDDEGKQKLKANELGDSIGGILNPIIGFTAGILTFLAFYIQYKSNKLQIELFNHGLKQEMDRLEDEKLEKKENIENDHKVNIKILKSLLDSLLEYYKTTGDYMDAFVQAEQAKPLKGNHMNFTVSSSYSTLNKLEFSELYKSIKFQFKNDHENWEKQFITLLNYLEYYDKVIFELREKYKEHSLKKFQVLSNASNEINDILNHIMSDEVLNKLGGIEYYLKNMIHMDKPIEERILLMQEEADYEEIQTNFLIPLIKDFLILFDHSKDPEHKILIDKLSTINKSIGIEKNQAITYYTHVEQMRIKYFENGNEFMNLIMDFSKKLN